MDQDNKPRNIAPEEVFLQAFEYFGTDRLTLESMVNIAMATNCPNPEVAQGVLANLVQVGMLTWEKDEQGTVLFSVVKPEEGKVN